VGYRRKYAATYHSSPACAHIASAWTLTSIPRLCLHGVAFRYSDLFLSLTLELLGPCIFVHNLSSASVLYGTYALQSIRHYEDFNPLNPELNPICYLLALLGAHHFLHVSRIRVKLLTFRLLMSYIYMEHPFLMFLDHTQRRSTVGRTPLDE